MFSFPNVGKSSFINKVGSREEMFSFPNVGKSSFINKVGRRKCLASPRQVELHQQGR